MEPQRFAECRRQLIDDKELRGPAFGRAYAALVDEWLASLLDQSVDVALIGCGGLGRREVAPESDLDLFIVHAPSVDVAATADKVWWDNSNAMSPAQFETLLDDFRAAGVQIFGVSPDSPSSHERFAAKCDLGIPLVSDPDHVLIGGLGLWVEKSMYGRTYNGVERSTFLIGEDGAVEREWRKVKAGGHAAEVLEAARPAG